MSNESRYKLSLIKVRQSPTAVWAWDLLVWRWKKGKQMLEGPRNTEKVTEKSTMHFAYMINLFLLQIAYGKWTELPKSGKHIIAIEGTFVVPSRKHMLRCNDICGLRFRGYERQIYNRNVCLFLWKPTTAAFQDERGSKKLSRWQQGVHWWPLMMGNNKYSRICIILGIANDWSSSLPGCLAPVCAFNHWLSLF